MGTPAYRCIPESACQAARGIIAGSGRRSVAAIGVGTGEVGHDSHDPKIPVKARAEHYSLYVMPKAKVGDILQKIYPRLVRYLAMEDPDFRSNGVRKLKNPFIKRHPENTKDPRDIPTAAISEPVQQKGGNPRYVEVGREGRSNI